MAETAEIVRLEPEVRLGSLSIESPKDLVKRGSELASALADIIESQELFVNIQNRKYVKAEGWMTLGAMLGVVPVEEYCRALPENKGFEAKVKLIRAKDEGLVGGASAECTYDEKNWTKRDSYSLRSMAITRATGKAYRLSFGWIMKLASYEATPAEEMYESNGSSQAAQEVASQKIAEFKGKKASPKPATHKPVDCLFYTMPDRFSGHRAVLINLKQYGESINDVAREGLHAILKNYVQELQDGSGQMWVPSVKIPALVAELEECKVPLRKVQATD